LERGAAALAALAADVATACRPLGFEPDARPFRPHLTIARLRRPAAVGDVLDRIELPPLRFDARELVLYRSHLSQQGARYEALARLPLSF
jgi:2'-5' RNA ligase